MVLPVQAAARQLHLSRAERLAGEAFAWMPGDDHSEPAWSRLGGALWLAAGATACFALYWAF